MIRLKNISKKDGIIHPYSSLSILSPAADTDYLIASTSITSTVAGDVFTLARGWLPTPMSLFLTVTDAALTTLTITIKIEGYNQFGVKQTEILTSPTGGGAVTTHSAMVWRNVTRVSCTSITAAAASDTLILGFTANSTSIKFGLPFIPNVDTASGVGGELDTVKAALDAGAIDTNFTVSASTASITGVAIAAGVGNLHVISDLSTLNY